MGSLRSLRQKDSLRSPVLRWYEDEKTIMWEEANLIYGDLSCNLVLRNSEFILAVKPIKTPVSSPITFLNSPEGVAPINEYFRLIRESRSGGLKRIGIDPNTMIIEDKSRWRGY